MTHDEHRDTLVPAGAYKVMRTRQFVTLPTTRSRNYFD
jgi:hypothetical protein